MPHGGTTAVSSEGGQARFDAFSRRRRFGYAQKPVASAKPQYAVNLRGRGTPRRVSDNLLFKKGKTLSERGTDLHGLGPARKWILLGISIC
jgi:hypothetical protein